VLEYLPIDKEKSPETQAVALVDKWIGYHEDQAKQTEITSNTLLNLMDGLAQEIAIKIRGHKEPELSYQEHKEFEDRMIDGWPEGKKVEVKVYQDPEYLTTFYLTRPYESKRDDDDDDWFDQEKSQRLEFILTSAELHTLFNRYTANQHTKNSYENPTSLGSRIACDKKVMERGGWEYVQGSKPDKLTYKRKGGYDYWRFSKVINAIE
jgi:DNA primase